jgi:hypothetical protein
MSQTTMNDNTGVVVLSPYSLLASLLGMELSEEEAEEFMAIATLIADVNAATNTPCCPSFEHPTTSPTTDSIHISTTNDVDVASTPPSSPPSPSTHPSTDTVPSTFSFSRDMERQFEQLYQAYFIHPSHRSRSHDRTHLSHRSQVYHAQLEALTQRALQSLRNHLRFLRDVSRQPNHSPDHGTPRRVASLRITNSRTIPSSDRLRSMSIHVPPPTTQLRQPIPFTQASESTTETTTSITTTTEPPTLPSIQTTDTFRFTTTFWESFDRILNDQLEYEASQCIKYMDPKTHIMIRIY